MQLQPTAVYMRNSKLKGTVSYTIVPIAYIPYDTSLIPRPSLMLIKLHERERAAGNEAVMLKALSLLSITSGQ